MKKMNKVVVYTHTRRHWVSESQTLKSAFYYVVFLSELARI